MACLQCRQSFSGLRLEVVRWAGWLVPRELEFTPEEHSAAWVSSWRGRVSAPLPVAPHGSVAQEVQGREAGGRLLLDGEGVVTGQESSVAELRAGSLEARGGRIWGEPLSRGSEVETCVFPS